MEILVQIVRLYPLGGRLYFPNITAVIPPATHAPCDKFYHHLTIIRDEVPSLALATVTNRIWWSIMI